VGEPIASRDPVPDRRHRRPVSSSIRLHVFEQGTLGWPLCIEAVGCTISSDPTCPFKIGMISKPFSLGRTSDCYCWPV